MKLILPKTPKTLKTLKTLNPKTLKALTTPKTLKTLKAPFDSSQTRPRHATSPSACPSAWLSWLPPRLSWPLCLHWPATAGLRLGVWGLEVSSFRGFFGIWVCCFGCMDPKLGPLRFHLRRHRNHLSAPRLNYERFVIPAGTRRFSWLQTPKVKYQSLVRVWGTPYT